MLIQFYLIFPLLFWAARKLGPMALPGHRLRPRLLCALHDLDCLSATRVVAPGRLCHLPAPGIRPRHGAGHVAQPLARTRRTLPSRRSRPSWPECCSIPPRSSSIETAYTYIFVDLATGACCFLVLVGISGIIARVTSAGKMIGLVGAYSYGIFLVHQPYVIWLGLRIREQPLWMFLLICRRHPDRSERLGNHSGKSDQRARHQIALVRQETRPLRRLGGRA